MLKGWVCKTRQHNLGHSLYRCHYRPLLHELEEKQKGLWGTTKVGMDEMISVSSLD